MIRKKIFGLLLCAISITGWSQEFKDVMRYEYKMTYKPGTETDTLIEDTVFLDVWENNSRFTTAERVKFIEFIADDENAIFRIESMTMSHVPSSGQNWVVQKEENAIFSFSRVGSSFFKTEESLNSIKWDIAAELSDYEGMKTQKATTDFGGRSWTVWFTQDIPLIEGPYKFKNLPGFVVKAASADGDYLFEFTKSEKAQTVLKYHTYEKADVIEKSELKKARKLAANKSMSQIFAEQGLQINFESVKDIPQELNKKVGDRANYIEKL